MSSSALSTPASRWPNKRPFSCGPLKVAVAARSPVLYAKVAQILRLYDRRWTRDEREIVIGIAETTTAAVPARGTFLQCARLVVDTAPDGLEATTVRGAYARLQRSGAVDLWQMLVPADAVERTALEDVEELVTLALTVGWRAAGWVPVHAAAIVREARCAVICAPSGGGKSTLTAGFVRRGWRAVGDDKLLLRVEQGVPQLAALQRTFNLHPRTNEWFPEVGDLERLPRYSSWTQKRKVHIETIWSAPTVDAARPTHLLRLRRGPQAGGIRTSVLGAAEIVPTLLRQIAIPRERVTASAILRTVAQTAGSLCGVDIAIGEDAYGDPDCLAALEAELG